MAKRKRREEKWGEVEERIQRKLEEARKRALLAGSFAEMEEIADEIGRELQRDILGAMAEQQEPLGRQECLKCGARMHRRGRKKRQMKSSTGEVLIERERWVCPECETGIFPLDQKLKLEAYRQTSVGLEKIVCELGIRLPYQQVSQVMAETMHLQVSDRQVKHIIDRQGQRAIAQRDKEIEAAWQAPEHVGKQPEGPEVLYLEADGAWINSRERLKMEGKVGLVHQGPVRIGRNRMALKSAVYVCSFQGSERLGQELYLEADRQGLERAQTLIFLSDGDPSLRHIHQTHFHDARYVLDWFHLRRNLRRALRPAKTEIDSDYVDACCMTLRDLLWFGEVDLVIERLERLRGRLRLAKARDAITDFKAFVLNNRDGIAYVDLHEQGFHVGSGPIEKAADLIVNRRCELRGMTWYRDTADGLCNLRTLHANGSLPWRDFWPV